MHWLDGEQELVARRMRQEERQLGWTGAVLLCLVVEALMVLATLAIIQASQ